MSRSPLTMQELLDLDITREQGNTAQEDFLNSFFTVNSSLGSPVEDNEPEEAESPLTLLPEIEIPIISGDTVLGNEQETKEARDWAIPNFGDQMTELSRISSHLGTVNNPIAIPTPSLAVDLTDLESSDDVDGAFNSEEESPRLGEMLEGTQETLSEKETNEIMTIAAPLTLPQSRGESLGGNLSEVVNKPARKAKRNSADREENQSPPLETEPKKARKRTPRGTWAYVPFSAVPPKREQVGAGEIGLGAPAGTGMDMLFQYQPERGLRKNIKRDGKYQARTTSLVGALAQQGI